MRLDSTRIGAVEESARTARASLALGNLRGFVILLVVSFHSVLAYLGSLPPAPFAFDAPPYSWRSFPIVDSQRWFGFDLFCAWQDVFLMSLMFFLSGLFVWPSLLRKASRTFLADRFLRLGLPFALVSGVVMPLTQYATYLQTAVDPGFSAYWRHLIALPFWPAGPMWFIWILLAMDILAAALYRFAPRWGDALGRFSSLAGSRPAKYFVVLFAISALAYVPLALVFTPWLWAHIGPFAFQLSRPLHYVCYFFAGVGIGAFGIERGLFASNGLLVGHWLRWLSAALVLFAAWLGLTGLTIGEAPSLAVQVADDVSFALACGSSCLVVVALFLRFAAKPLRVFAGLNDNAYGMYLIHYFFVVWLQFALLEAALPAVAKAGVVFSVALTLSWGATAAIRRIPAAGRVLGTERRALAKMS